MKILSRIHACFDLLGDNFLVFGLVVLADFPGNPCIGSVQVANNGVQFSLFIAWKKASLNLLAYAVVVTTFTYD